MSDESKISFTLKIVGVIIIIPLIDDYIQAIIVNRLRFLKNNPTLMNYLFQTGNPQTIERLKEFITTKKIRVVIGYPREQSTLPAYVIMLAPEQEQPSGLGENWEAYGVEGLGDIESTESEMAEDYLSDMIASTFMNATYRIECWSDNGDLTALMYCILKWCLWSSRKDMLKIGWTNIRLEGTDLEPAPDYMPVFVYRRAAQLILTYDNLYHEDVTQAYQLLDVIAHPDKYHKDGEGNVVDENEKVILEATHNIILNPHFYENGVVSYDIKKTQIPIYLSTIDEFPYMGDSDTLYLQQESGGIIKAYVWDETTQQYKPTMLNTLSHKNIIAINSKG